MGNKDNGMKIHSIGYHRPSRRKLTVLIERLLVLLGRVFFMHDTVRNDYNGWYLTVLANSVMKI